MASASSSYILAGSNIPITSRDTQRAFHLDNLALYLKKGGIYEKETVDCIETELDSLLVFNRQFISAGDQEIKKHAYTSLVAIAINNVLKQKGFDDKNIEEVILGNLRFMVLPILKPVAKRMGRSEDPWSVFLPYARDGTLNGYSTFNPEIIEASDDRLDFDLHHCVFYDLFKRNKTEHLGPIFCKYDDILAGLIKEWVGFERKETIACGAEKCTFRYCSKKGKDNDW